MGQSRRLKKQQSGVQSQDVNRKVAQGEAFYDQKEQIDVLVPAKDGDKKPQFKPAVKETRLTSKQKKRLEKIVERKEKNQARATLLEDLQKVALPANQAQYMTRTAEMSTQRQTLRQQLRSDLLAERAGLPVGKDSRLHRTVGDNSPIVETDLKPTDSTDAPIKKPVKKKARIEGKAKESTSNKAAGFLAYALGDMAKRGAVPTSIHGPTATLREVDSDSDSDGEEENMSENEDQQTPQAVKPTPVVKPTPTPPVAKPTAKAKREAAVFVNVLRTEEVQQARLQLPILAEEQVIMEAVRAHPIVLLCGETGSGKTTQLPQFLYEAGFGSGRGPYPGAIAVTEPRRVAAISMSKRVGEELGNPALAGYQIRYAGNVTDETRLKFMTDGVLLKEMERDFLLSNYSAVIVDEAHERSLNTDILVGMLSRLVPMRNAMAAEPGAKIGPIRLIIMSATLRVEDFTTNTRLFPTPPPVLEVKARQYPVAIHFNKDTPHNDHIGEAYRKASKIHTRLPDGGILIFVTSQQEVTQLCRKLRQRFPKPSTTTDIPPVTVDLAKYSLTPQEEKEDHQQYDVEEEEAAAEMMEGTNDMTDEIDGHLSEDSDMDDSDIEGDRLAEGDMAQPLHVLPLYSMLPQAQQMRVFEPPPPGTRLCVVSTNVAETSLTIPNIRYVIDTGKVKQKHYDTQSCLSRFEVEWVSQASANQRSGRAGRTGPGHCYRLYSSAVLANYMEMFSDPEVLRLPIDGLVLQMKGMGIDNVVNFPFPTPPDAEALSDAETLLKTLGALDNKGHITSMGRTMARFPVSPRYARMLMEAKRVGCLEYTIALAAALTVGNLYDESALAGGAEEGDEGTEEIVDAVAKERRKAAYAIMNRWVGNNPRSDLLTMLKSVGAFEYAGGTEEFCQANLLRHKSMVEIRKLRRQLTSVVNGVFTKANCTIDPTMKPPGPKTQKVVLSAFGAQVAKRVEIKGRTDEELKARRGAYECEAVKEMVYIHPRSCLAGSRPDMIVYSEIVHGNRMLMKGVTAIKAEWLPSLVPSLCSFGIPLQSPAPAYDPQTDAVMCSMASTYGKRVAWPLPIVRTEFPIDNGDRYKFFAQALLEGKVFSALQVMVDKLVSSPTLLRKVWTQEKVVALLAPLAEASICSRDALAERWAVEPKFLLSGYSLWVGPNDRRALAAMWPPIGKAPKKASQVTQVIPDQPEVASDSGSDSD